MAVNIQNKVLTMNEKHYHLLKQLKDADPEVRHDALMILMELESEEELVSDDFKDLLNQDDQVLQQYAIQAIGRNRIEDAYDVLADFFKNSMNPILLSTALSVFQETESPVFFDRVRNKLENAWQEKPAGGKKHSNDLMDQLFGEEELLDQILVPGLKYFQTLESIDHHEFLYAYLQHKNVHVRWNTLMIFNRLELPLDKTLLERISQNDTYAPIRELADIMLTKNDAP